MTDTLTELDPEQLRRELVRLFAEPKSLHHIVAAGLDGVRRHLADLCTAIEGAENGADQVVDTVAQLANLVRQEQRKHLGAVAQAKKEHARAERLAAENERLRAAAAAPRPMQIATADGFVDLQAKAEQQLRQALAEEAAHVDRVLLGIEPPPAGPCWCGHDPDTHVTDDGDNAICRACYGAPQLPGVTAFHVYVHTPEQP